MASFKDFSNYKFEFIRLDKKITKKCTPAAYYQRWMEKYAKIFKSDFSNLCGIEWDLRCKKALREVFASSTFYVEAKKGLRMRCYASYYFCLYYSLFHAIYAVILFDTNTAFSSFVDITHSNLINIFVSNFANSKKDVLSKSVKQQFYNLKYRREYYSYVTPINNLFNYEEDLQDLKETVQDCFQLASFHSLMVENSYNKNVKSIINFTNSEEVYEFQDMFEKLFAKRNKEGKRFNIDPAVENYRNEMLTYGCRPDYFALDLEHQYDELHTYDGFYDEKDEKSEEAVMASEIFSFVYEAIN